MAWSISSVVTPGRTSRSASLSAETSTRPAWRIFSISLLDLSSIMNGRRSPVDGRRWRSWFPAPSRSLPSTDQWRVKRRASEPLAFGGRDGPLPRPACSAALSGPLAAPHEAFVLAHQELGFDLVHQVERHPHH